MVQIPILPECNSVLLTGLEFNCRVTDFCLGPNTIKSESKVIQYTHKFAL